MKKILWMALAISCIAVPSFAQQAAMPASPAQPPATAQPVVTAQPPVQTTTMAPAPATTTPSLANSEHGMAVLLLDRAMKVLQDAADKKTGDVTIDRGLLDEVRAELTQVKAALKTEKP